MGVGEEEREKQQRQGHGDRGCLPPWPKGERSMKGNGEKTKKGERAYLSLLPLALVTADLAERCREGEEDIGTLWGWI